MVREMILESGINNTFWTKIVLGRTYVKNLYPTCAPQRNISPIELQTYVLSDIQYLYILGYNVYVVLYNEEHNLKLAKYDPRTFKGKLVRFNSYTIYKIYIESYKKVIQVIDQ